MIARRLPVCLVAGLAASTLSARSALADNSRVALVKDFLPGNGDGPSTSKAMVLNDVLYFAADDGTHGLELWRSDGTAAGTVLVADINPGPAGSDPYLMTIVNGALVFSAVYPGTGRELWKSDGTAAGTVFVKDIYPAAGDGVRTEYSWRGTPVVNGTLFFVANDNVAGPELWKSDLTAAGTVLVKDFIPGNPVICCDFLWAPEALTSAGGTLFFAATNGTLSNVLWKSDGTPTGTVIVKNVRPQNLFDLNGTLMFTSSTDGDYAFWRSDGTESGTVVVVDDLRASGGFVWNGFLYFAGYQASTTGEELWKTDGTTAGTTLVKDLHPGTASGSPCGFIEFNGALFFTTCNGSDTTATWKTDGTANGTVVVPLIPNSTNFVVLHVTVNGTLYVGARTPSFGSELWRTDGTVAGSFRLTDLPVGEFGSAPKPLGVIGGSVLFTAGVDNSARTKLWKIARTTSDFDGEGNADLTVYRPGSSEWWINRSTANFTTSLVVPWGIAGDQPAPADFDGDGKVDPAVFRPAAGGSTWFVRRSQTNYTSGYAVTWGTAGDLPVPGYYDVDRFADPAVYRPSTGQWWIAGSTGSTILLSWGTTDDVPVPADYDGDGRTDIAVYRPSTGQWLIKTSTSNFASWMGIAWGAPGEIPIPGDFDGDGKADPAVYRPNDGLWFVAISSASYGTQWTFLWGVQAAGDQPMPADFDGDGRVDPTVYRASTGEWFILRSRETYSAFQQVQWGNSAQGDVPIRER